MAGIVDIQLNRLLALLADRNMDLELDYAALTWPAEGGTIRSTERDR